MRLGNTILLSFCLLLGGASQAEAKDPVSAFSGRIIITGKKRLPTSWKNGNTFIAQVKKAQNYVVWPEDEKAKEKSWRFEYVAFFKRPLSDREVTIKIYQVDGREMRLMANGVFEQYLAGRGERMYASAVTLSEQNGFEMNKEYLMTVESRRMRLASSKLILRAQGPNYSGKVTFSEDETK